MAHATKAQRLAHPETHYRTPDDLLRDDTLSAEEKKKALDVWEQDARQMLTASNEGMPGSNEGEKTNDHHQLGQIERAKETLGERPTHKPAH